MFKINLLLFEKHINSLSEILDITLTEIDVLLTQFRTGRNDNCQNDSTKTIKIHAYVTIVDTKPYDNKRIESPITMHLLNEK